MFKNVSAAWHFVLLPQNISKEISERFDFQKAGWGSIKVCVFLGSSKWKTSIFPDKKRKAYILPLKLEIRKKEKIKMGDTVSFDVEIIL